MRVFSWALYDFANTIFSMNIVSLYFALWVTDTMGGRPVQYSIANGLATALIVLSLPALGVVSDGYRRRMPFLVACTMACVVATGLIGVVRDLTGGLVLFGVALCGYQMSLSFYNALLPEVAGSPARVGRTSGYGVALGYLGAILGMLMVVPFVDSDALGMLPEFLRGIVRAICVEDVGRGETFARANAFLPTGVLFLLFALPCFILVRESGGGRIRWREIPGKVRKGFRKVNSTYRATKRYPGVFRFLLGNFFVCDAANTVIVFMAVYLNRVSGFGDAEVRQFLVVSTTCAAIGSWGCGFVADRLGHLKTFAGVIVLWGVGLGLAMNATSGIGMWIAGCVMGVCLGSTWVAGRASLVSLVPKAEVGEFFGLYGITEKMGTVIGPLAWGVVVELFWWAGDVGYRLAVWVLVVFLGIGFYLVRGVHAERAKTRAGR